MTVCKIEFEGKEIACVDSVDALESKLVEIVDSFNPPNPIVGIIHENGNNLGVGISPKYCFLNYMDASLDPPYYSSIGDGSIAVEADVVEFMMSETNHVSEIPRKHIISFEDVLRAARLFFETGTWPETAIMWEMD